eukprot:m.157912 g.157912  ORF g.157912 m.157912 type:complete len:362 (+) comp38718_c0_seq1:14-1099(+)
MTTSFRKKVASKSRPTLPPGTKPSVQHGQLLTSTGVPSVDHLLGGGLAVGTALLIEEDTYALYADVLLRFYLAEGVASGHGIYVATAHCNAVDLVKDLPACCEDLGEGGSGTQLKEEMKIAWRYQRLPEFQSGRSVKFGHSFDLSQKMAESDISKAAVTTFDGLAATYSTEVLYSKLVDSICTCIDQGKYSTSAQCECRNVLRIGISSLGSPLWNDNQSSILQFLYNLRGLLRSAYAVALVTIPTHLFHDEAFVRRVEHLGDSVVRLESFEGSDKAKNPLYKDYHGLFHIRRLPRINSLICHEPETMELAFKLRRKKFSVEKLYLPPELSETASRTSQQGSSRGASTFVGMKEKPKPSLDF